MDAVDLSKVCRLCLKGGEVMCPIFAQSQTNGNLSLPQRIMCCAQIKLSEGDGMPDNVCSACLTQVDLSYQFKLQCERSDLTLRGSMKSDQLSEDESMEEGEQWDMTKFTPEVIIKEDNDSSENLINGSYGDENGQDYHRQALPPPPLYPLATMLVDGTSGSIASLLSHPSLHSSLASEQFQETRQQLLEQAIQQQQQNHAQQQAFAQELLRPSQAASNQSRRCRGGDKLFKCRQCNKSYSFSSALSRHKAVHNTALRPHVCQICNKGFTQVDKLLRHQKTHSMDFFMACDLCQRPFKSFAAYQKHRVTGGCMMMNNGQLVSQSHQMMRDISDNHAKPLSESQQHSPPLMVSIDDSSSAVDASDAGDNSQAQQSPNASLSGRNSGKGKPEFQCKVCEKMFATRGSLEVHSTIHTGVRPFACSACEKSFRHKVNLMEHFQRKHSLVRPYICDVCAARFVTKQELVRHYRKHIGE